VSSRVRRHPSIAQDLRVDHVGEASFRAAQRFPVALAGLAFALVVGPARGVTLDLGDGHDVQGVVELPVPGAGGVVAHDIAGGDLQRGDAGVGSEVCRGVEWVDRPGVGQQLRGGEGPDAVQVGQGGATLRDRRPGRLGGRGDAPVQPADLGDQVGGDAPLGAGQQSAWCAAGQRRSRQTAWSTSTTRNVVAVSAATTVILSSRSRAASGAPSRWRLRSPTALRESGRAPRPARAANGQRRPRSSSPCADPPR
jgi:hypothetical protein